MVMRILIIDDHPLFREGLEFLLFELDSKLELDSAGDCTEALALLTKREYDLVLLDLKLPGKNGVDALNCIREYRSDLPVVVLSGEETQPLVYAAIEAGAMGFIPKSVTSATLIQSLRQILAGHVYLPPSSVMQASANIVSSESILNEFTSRQQDVLRCVIQGKTNKTIASELAVTEATVKTHIAAILRALKVQNRTEAVYAVAKMGLKVG